MIFLRVFNDSDVAYDRVAHGPQVGSKRITRFHDLMIFPRVFYRSASLPGWAVGSFQGGHLSVECMPPCRLTSWWFSLGIFIKRWSWFHDLMISPRVFDRFVIGLPVDLEDCTAFPIWWFSIGFFIKLQGLNALDGRWGSRLAILRIVLHPCGARRGGIWNYTTMTIQRTSAGYNVRGRA